MITQTDGLLVISIKDMDYGSHNAHNSFVLLQKNNGYNW